MNFDVCFAKTQHMEWLSRHDPHVPDHWVKRCITNSEYIIALAKDNPVGFLRYSWFWGAVPYMDMIQVSPEHRRCGIGKSLFRFWETAMREQHAITLMTSSVADEPEPRAWHQSNGFRESGSVSFGAFQPEAEVFLIKDLR
jgi:ribosomal protein S18 acetylase RimI-like enzyme